MILDVATYRYDLGVHACDVREGETYNIFAVECQHCHINTVILCFHNHFRN